MVDLHRPNQHRRLRSVGFMLVLSLLVGELALLGWRQAQLSPSSPQAITIDSPGSVSSTTTTTVSLSTTPAPQTLAPTSTSVVSIAGLITYTLAASAQITISATKSSWLEVRRSQSGPLLWEGTLSPGGSKTYPRPLWIRFGDPSGIAVTADGTPLTLSSDGPVNLMVR